MKSIEFVGDVFASRFVQLQMLQTYENLSEHTPLETVFYFPIDIGFGLSKIKMEVYDLLDPNSEPRVIETEIQERKKAEQTFVDAITQGTSMPIMAKYTMTDS